MKIKLYCVQEVYNTSNPEDAVGPLHIFLEEREREWFFVDHVESDYCFYQTFEKEITIE